ncbi:MAG: zinc ribbon domain-containing protein [Chloroflexi bacterium]|nr:zinc ribbon domain-containing protein [Chloroflexota bacterium]
MPRITCENCGARRRSGEAFCPHCGWHAAGESARQVVIAPPRAVAPYRLDRAVMIGGATTVGLSAAWLAVRWIAPRIASALADRLRPPRVPAIRPQAPASGDEMRVEMVVWSRRIFTRRK